MLTFSNKYEHGLGTHLRNDLLTRIRWKFTCTFERITENPFCIVYLLHGTSTLMKNQIL